MLDIMCLAKPSTFKLNQRKRQKYDLSTHKFLKFKTIQRSGVFKWQKANNFELLSVVLTKRTDKLEQKFNLYCKRMPYTDYC